VEVVSTAGAGDALLAGTIAGLTAGLPLRSGSSEGGERELSSAIDLGILLASFSVTSPHTIHPDANLSALVKFASDRGYFLSTSFLQACAKGECIPVASPSSAISGS
jgi:sugar/nucleoside kinase (ribokinase family)